jgi:hypothetical protein
MVSAIRRLDELPPHLTTGLGPLQGPVSALDLQALEATIAPWQLPADVVAQLMWTDGLVREAWWPSLNAGPLLRARAIARDYKLHQEWASEAALPFLLPLYGRPTSRRPSTPR